jgi:hypothetical protein
MRPTLQPCAWTMTTDWVLASAVDFAMAGLAALGAAPTLAITTKPLAERRHLHALSASKPD